MPQGRDARSFAAARVAAIGPGTARALRNHGIIADVVPETFVAEGLVEALKDIPVQRALIARAAEARDVLPDALRARGAEVDVVALYETVADPLGEAELAAVAARTTSPSRHHRPCGSSSRAPPRPSATARVWSASGR